MSPTDSLSAMAEKRKNEFLRYGKRGEHEFIRFGRMLPSKKSSAEKLFSDDNRHAITRMYARNLANMSLHQSHGIIC